VKKWNILVWANDGKKYCQSFHVIEMSAEAAEQYLLENFPYPKLRPTITVQGVEEMEDASLFLPGLVYKSGKAYFA
jgi:hypothetical protein